MNVAAATFAVLDVETTGLDPKEHELLEIAAVLTSISEFDECKILGMWQTYVYPEKGIPAEISGLTGITDEMVDGAPGRQTALNALSEFLYRFDEREDGHALVGVAHNAEFDSAFLDLTAPKVPFLCTKRLAQHLWPMAPNHKNGTLRFWRGVDVDTMGIPAHRALADCLVTGAVLRDLLTCDEFPAGVTDVDALIDFAEAPIIFDTWSFGKHRGKPIAGTDPSYIAWCLRDMKDLSRDMRATLELQLKGAA